jgi:RNA polymerase sigma-B factor
MTAAQRAFTCRHLGLARQQAQHFSRRTGLPYDDLLGPAYEGLCKGVLGYDHRLGHRPSSYLVPKVKGELLHHLRDHTYLVRIPHRLRELWLRGRQLLEAGHSDSAIAADCGVPLALWLECRRACSQPPLPLPGEL